MFLTYVFQIAVYAQVILITTIADLVRCELKLTENEMAFVTSVSTHVSLKQNEWLVIAVFSKVHQMTGCNS